MENMNFLTNRYREKLELEGFIKKVLVVFLILGGLILGGYSVIKPIQFGIQENIDRENSKIAEHKNTIKLLQTKLKTGTNLGTKISLIREIFVQKNLRVSEVLKSLDKDVPDNVWLETLIYENRRIRIKGFSLKENHRTSEENAYYFEKRLIDSGLYSNVSLSYLKQGIKHGEKINEFEYILDLK